MSGTNVGAGGNPGTKQGNPTSVVTHPPLLPFMDGLGLPNFSQLINDPFLHDPT